MILILTADLGGRRVGKLGTGERTQYSNIPVDPAFLYGTWWQTDDRGEEAIGAQVDTMSKSEIYPAELGEYASVCHELL